MSFKYINPGFASLMDKDWDHTRGDTPEQFINATNQYSKTGVCFVVPTNKTAGVILAPLQVPPKIIEIWLRFDFYINLTEPFKSVVFTANFLPQYSDTNMIINIRDNGDGSYMAVAGVNAGYEFYGSLDENCAFDKIGTFLGLKSGVNSVWLHATHDTVEHQTTVEAKLNSRIFSGSEEEYIEGLYEYEPSIRFSNMANDPTAIFSNIIASDEPIDINEKIIPLPISTTNSNMSTLEGGLYVADKVGQKILQSVDVFSLSETYGADSPITNIFLAASPTYTESGTGTLTALYKINDVVTEQGIFGITDSDTHTIEHSEYNEWTKETDTWTEEIPPTDYAFCSWEVASSTTIADLSEMEFGWKASE